MSKEIIEGSRTSFGPRETEKLAPATIAYSSVKELHVPINFDGFPVVDADDSTIQSVPANAFIESATLHVVEAFTSAGAATMTIGLYESDGTVIDLDGIDAAIALSAINADGERVICDGALVAGLQGIGVAAGQVVVVEASTSNPYTAGRAVLVIKYTELPA